MESQPQNPEFRINPENFRPWHSEEKVLVLQLSNSYLSLVSIFFLKSLTNEIVGNEHQGNNQ